MCSPPPLLFPSVFFLFPLSFPLLHHLCPISTCSLPSPVPIPSPLLKAFSQIKSLLRWLVLVSSSVNLVSTDVKSEWILPAIHGSPDTFILSLLPPYSLTYTLPSTTLQLSKTHVNNFTCLYLIRGKHRRCSFYARDFIIWVIARTVCVA